MIYAKSFNSKRFYSISMENMEIMSFGAVGGKYSPLQTENMTKEGIANHLP